METDPQGFLKNPNSWNEVIAIRLAEIEGLALNKHHWTVIHFLRQFYQNTQTTPPIRSLVKHLKEKYGPEIGNSTYLHQLFPNDLLKLSCKISGLPKPTRCI